MLSKANYLGNIPSEFIYRDRIFRSARQKKKKKRYNGHRGSGARIKQPYLCMGCRNSVWVSQALARQIISKLKWINSSQFTPLA